MIKLKDLYILLIQFPMNFISTFSTFTAVFPEPIDFLKVSKIEENHNTFWSVHYFFDRTNRVHSRCDSSSLSRSFFTKKMQSSNEARIFVSSIFFFGR